MASSNAYEKHYLTNRRLINDDKYVLVFFKSDNTFIIKKKSNLHGVDENGMVNIKDREKSYIGFCLFEGKVFFFVHVFIQLNETVHGSVSTGTKNEIEAAAERLDKEMNTDLESDCETMLRNSKAKPPRQNSTTTTTTKNSCNSNIENSGSSATKSVSNQKRNDQGDRKMNCFFFSLQY